MIVYEPGNIDLLMLIHDRFVKIAKKFDISQRF